MSTESLYRDKLVLVTGGAGFIGSHLVRKLLSLGARVVASDNLQSGKWSNLPSPDASLTNVVADVRDNEATSQLITKYKFDFIFHLAANASVPGSVTEPNYDWESNALGTFRILDAVRRSGSAARVVCASSGAVYGEPKTFPIREEDPVSPISPYGASKACSELSVQTFHRVYKTPAVSARLFNAYGPRMARFVILDFLKKLTANPKLLEVLGTGQQVRDFTYVEDTVQGLLLLGNKGVPGESYNVSSGRSSSVLNLAAQIIAARGLTGTCEIKTTGTSWVGDAQRWEVSIDKIKTLGFQPAWPLERGLIPTIAWYDELR